MRRISLLVLVGCAQQARLPASYFAETAKALEPGQTSITAAGGGGASLGPRAVGGSARVRVGVGDGQEVGVQLDLTVLHVAAQNCFHDCDLFNYSLERMHAYGAQASWKKQLAPQAAIIATAGVTHHDALAAVIVGDGFGTSATGSFALVRSLSLSHTVSAYSGTRLSAETPVGRRDPYAAGAFELSSVVGLDIAVTPGVHIYLEAGGAFAGDNQESYVPMFHGDAIGALRATL